MAKQPAAPKPFEVLSCEKKSSPGLYEVTCVEADGNPASGLFRKADLENKIHTLQGIQYTGDSPNVAENNQRNADHVKWMQAVLGAIENLPAPKAKTVPQDRSKKPEQAQDVTP